MLTTSWPQACASLSSTVDAGQEVGQSWLFHGLFFTDFQATVSPNSPIPDRGFNIANGIGLFPARSHHPGGVNAALTDGSVRWYTSSISSPIWRALGTRAGNDLIPSSL